MRIRALILVVAWASFSCRSQVDSAPEPLPSCSIGQRANAIGDTVSVAVTPRVDGPSSLSFGSDEGALIRRQLYETLVTIDCNGTLHPGLSSHWEVHDSGKEWRFVIRPGAIFWDGVPVSIVDVIESWERNWSAIEPWVPAGDYFNVAEAISYDRLVVRLDEVDPTFPAQLARPDLAVSLRPVSPNSWPIGTGAYRPDIETASSGVVTLRPRDETRPLLRFVSVGGGDARDALDAGLDVVLGRAKEAVDYVAHRTDYEDHPLRWNETVALVMRQQDGDLSGAVSGRIESLQSEIARDAVRVDARATVCPPVTGRRVSLPQSMRSSGDLVHDALDATTRAVSERLVAVTSDTVASRAVGLPEFRRVVQSDVSNVFDRVRSGVFSGAIVRYEHWSPCETPSRLFADLDGLVLMPLIDTRTHLFAGAGKIEASIGRDGTPLFFPIPYE